MIFDSINHGILLNSLGEVETTIDAVERFPGDVDRRVACVQHLTQMCAGLRSFYEARGMTDLDSPLFVKVEPEHTAIVLEGLRHTLSHANGVGHYLFVESMLDDYDASIASAG